MYVKILATMGVGADGLVQMLQENYIEAERRQNLDEPLYSKSSNGDFECMSYFDLLRERREIIQDLYELGYGAQILSVIREFDLSGQHNVCD